MPNYQGIFLRGSGSQAVNINAIAGSNTAVQKMYNSPSIGTIFADEAAQTQTSDYVNQINQEVKTFVTGGSGLVRIRFRLIIVMQLVVKIILPPTTQ